MLEGWGSKGESAVAAGIATNAVPALWMAMVSTRFQEVYSLAAWYQDILKRYEQLAAWTSGSIVTPNCVWLPGLFNPKVRPFTTRFCSSLACALLLLQ